MKITKVEGLANIANDIRIGIIEQVYNASSGHPGGSLSCATCKHLTLHRKH